MQDKIEKLREKIAKQEGYIETTQTRLAGLRQERAALQGRLTQMEGEQVMELLREKNVSPEDLKALLAAADSPNEKNKSVYTHPTTQTTGGFSDDET